jgi:hypothetical protein
MKYPANQTMRKSQGATMSNQAKDRPKSKSYRESAAATSGRTASGKPIPPAKAGKGTCA